MTPFAPPPIPRSPCVLLTESINTDCSALFVENGQQSTISQTCCSLIQTANNDRCFCDADVKNILGASKIETIRLVGPFLCGTDLRILTTTEQCVEEAPPVVVEISPPPSAPSPAPAPRRRPACRRPPSPRRCRPPAPPQHHLQQQVCRISILHHALQTRDLLLLEQHVDVVVHVVLHRQATLAQGQTPLLCSRNIMVCFLSSTDTIVCTSDEPP